MAFEVYMMDRRELLRYKADLENPDFQEKYTKWRKAYTDNGRRPAGMSPDLLFLLAVEFPKPVEPIEAVEAEKPAEPENNSEPVPEKRGPGRLRKEPALT